MRELGKNVAIKATEMLQTGKQLANISGQGGDHDQETLHHVRRVAHDLRNIASDTVHTINKIKTLEGLQQLTDKVIFKYMGIHCQSFM